MKTYHIVPHQSQSKEEEGYKLVDLVVEGEETPVLSGTLPVNAEIYLHKHVCDDDVIIGFYPHKTITGAEMREDMRVILERTARMLAEWKRNQAPRWLQWLQFRWLWLVWDIEDALWRIGHVLRRAEGGK